MNKHWIANTIVMIGVAAGALGGAFAGEINDGRWAMQPSERPGTVQFSLHGARKTHDFMHVSNWPTSEFSGLDLAQDTQFTLTRDAGKFEFEGTLRDSSGAGSFGFTPNPEYAQEMKALGFGGVERHQIQFAIHNVSVGFARDMKSANLKDLDSDKLLAFRIHGVTREFIDHLHAAGLNERDSGLLIAFRIHGVTPELVSDVQKLGFEKPESGQLVAMRIHGVTPEYIRELQGRGIKNLTIDKLVAMKIHGID